MDYKTFENVVRKINKDIYVELSDKNDGIAGVFYQGVRLLTIPNPIYEFKRDDYGITTPNGTFIKHRTIDEAVDMANGMMARIKAGGDDADAIMGRGEYSEKALA